VLSRSTTIVIPLIFSGRLLLRCCTLPHCCSCSFFSMPSSTSAHLPPTLSLPWTPEEKRHEVDGKERGLKVCREEWLLVRFLGKKKLRGYRNRMKEYGNGSTKVTFTLVSPADPTQMMSTSSSIATPPMRPVLTFHLVLLNQRAMMRIATAADSRFSIFPS
jgi:hypothetical protein